jgi:hypothetical protein
MDKELATFLLNRVLTTVLTTNILHFKPMEIDAGATMTLLLSQNMEKQTVMKMEDTNLNLSTKM